MTLDPLSASQLCLDGSRAAPVNPVENCFDFLIFKYFNFVFKINIWCWLGYIL